MGSPPRARGAERLDQGARSSKGSPPACAGSRPRRRSGACRSRDHPRVRGEQLASVNANTGPLGLPPVRGEQNCWIRTRTVGAGSPPRARGAGEWGRVAGDGRRITPACAGSRPGSWHRHWRPGDHPRVRGEQDSTFTLNLNDDGSPPRARGAVGGTTAVHVVGGITPACAGSSRGHGWRRRARWDHPRVRGEQQQALEWLEGVPGSPPRARGAAATPPDRGCRVGITPACAGSRLC